MRTIAAWRGRLELLALLIALSLTSVGAGFHVLALADEESSYTLALRSIAILADLGLALGCVLALLIVMLPRIVFQWPRTTPNGLALTALVATAVAAVVIGAMGVVGLAGGLSEIGVDEFDRQFSSSSSEVWAEILLGLGATVVSATALIYAVMGVVALVGGRDRPMVEPDLGPPQPGFESGPVQPMMTPGPVHPGSG